MTKKPVRRSNSLRAWRRPARRTPRYGCAASASTAAAYSAGSWLLSPAWRSSHAFVSRSNVRSATKVVVTVKRHSAEPGEALLNGDNLPTIGGAEAFSDFLPLLGRKLVIVFLLRRDRHIDRRSVRQVDVPHDHLALLHLRCEPQHHASRVAQPRARQEQLVRRRKHAISLDAMSGLAAARSDRPHSSRTQQPPTSSRAPCSRRQPRAACPQATAGCCRRSRSRTAPRASNARRARAAVAPRAMAGHPLDTARP
jgi:hypothetical protein